MQFSKNASFGAVFKNKNTLSGKIQNEICLFTIFPQNLGSFPRGEGRKDESCHIHQNQQPRDDEHRDDGEGAVEAVSPVPVLGGRNPSMSHGDSLAIKPSTFSGLLFTFRVSGKHFGRRVSLWQCMAFVKELEIFSRI